MEILIGFGLFVLAVVVGVGFALADWIIDTKEERAYKKKHEGENSVFKYNDK